MLQLLTLPDAIKPAFAGSVIHVKKVTHVRTINGKLNWSKIVKGMFGNVDKMLQA